MGNDEVAVVISFFAGALLHSIWRNWFVSIAIPVVTTFFALGYLESHRAYTGGGASFYVFIQVFAALYSGIAAATAAWLIQKFFPRVPK
jgi:hypothetical protein